MMKLIEVFLISSIVGIFLLLCYSIYNDVTAEKIEINKADFSCVQTHQDMILVPVGKVIVPTYHSICDKYERNK